MGRPRKDSVTVSEPIPGTTETNVETPAVEKPVVEEKPAFVTEKFPIATANGKFQAVKAEDGRYVVYNPAGQRATGFVTLTEAEDIVRAQNQAAHIK